MGKGNKHRGNHDRKKDDRGQDKKFSQKTFGGHGYKHSQTIGGMAGQEERHDDACFAAIKAVRSVRAKLETHEKALSTAQLDFKPYLEAKRRMLELERKLGKVPAFSEYQKTRKELRTAVNKLNEEKPKCRRCKFATMIKEPPVEPAEPKKAEAAAQPAPEPPMNPVIVPGTVIGNPSETRSVGTVGEGAA